MKKEYDILKEIKRLKSVRGYGTELISIYIPAGYNLAEETGKLREEHSQSSNIKSKQVRTNVQSAIDKILQYLKLFRETPKNGLAVFAGNISDSPGKTNIELFSMEPDLPIKVNIYRCDSTFLLEPIEEIVGARDTYLLVVMDGREATVATLNGTHTHVIKKLNSMVHAKVRKGGQSAARYERVIEESIGQYYVRVSEIVNATFLQNTKIKGLIVGGPGPTKENFAKSNSVNYQVKILGVYDTGYTDEYGLQELLDKAAELLKEQELTQERKVVERFIQETVRNGLAVHGYEETKKALEMNKVNLLILSKDFELVKRKCDKCEKEIIVSLFKSEDETDRQYDKRRLDVLNNTDAETERKHDDNGVFHTEHGDILGDLIELADTKGAETQFVSSEGSLGKQFLMGFSGIGALLRYK